MCYHVEGSTFTRKVSCSLYEKSEPLHGYKKLYAYARMESVYMKYKVYKSVSQHMKTTILACIWVIRARNIVTRS